MRRLGSVILDLVVALVLFIGIEAHEGRFSTLGSIFSINTWANIPAEDIWKFLICLFIVVITLGMFEGDF